jgi:hypothetical protein
MGDSQNQQPLPRWVRLMGMPRSIKRRAMVRSVIVLAIMAAGILVFTVVGSANDTLFSLIAFCFGMAAVGIATTACVWGWLAVRWMDRHAAWPAG